MQNPTSKSTDDLGVTAGTLLHTGKAILTGVNLQGAAADVTIVVYDNTSAAGKVIFQYTLDVSLAGLAAYIELPDVRCDNGLFVVTTGAGAAAHVHYK